MMYELVENYKIKARFISRESVRVAEIANEENKWHKDDFPIFMKVRRKYLKK
jgi:hypothetical protein